MSEYVMVGIFWFEIYFLSFEVAFSQMEMVAKNKYSCQLSSIQVDSHAKEQNDLGLQTMSQKLPGDAVGSEICSETCGNTTFCVGTFANNTAQMNFNWFCCRWMFKTLSEDLVAISFQSSKIASVGDLTKARGTPVAAVTGVG